MQRLILFMALLTLGLSSGSVVSEGWSSPITNRAEDPSPASLSIKNASNAQAKRLEDAVRRFTAADLVLPQLTVVFHGDENPCKGHPGLFRADTDPWEIHICSESVEIVYEHELAHAWAAHNLNGQQRRDFMEIAGYETWNDKDYPWNERGTEGAARVIQQGISGLPLPPVLSVKTRQLHVEGYQFLTGVPSPRYVAWLDTYGDETLSSVSVGT